MLQGESRHPEFPQRPSADPERRAERLVDVLRGAPEREYQQRDRSVRTSRESIDPVIWLRNQYTNDWGQMICQICKEEMPFRKRDEEYYFESVEIFDRDTFSKEHQALFLALCPVCAAKYKEFIKRDEDAMVGLKHALTNSSGFEIPIRLGELSSTVRFVEIHAYDLRTILRESDQ